MRVQVLQIKYLQCRSLKDKGIPGWRSKLGEFLDKNWETKFHLGIPNYFFCYPRTGNKSFVNHHQICVLPRTGNTKQIFSTWSCMEVPFIVQIVIEDLSWSYTNCSPMRLHTHNNCQFGTFAYGWLLLHMMGKI